ncbi:MAG: hypothetical protein ACKV1O_25935 [Saprospiraceae bacterium]
MNNSYQQFPDSARVWIYQSDRPFPEEALADIQKKVQDFAQRWVSHDRRLRAFADVWHHRFIILMVDEGMADASGCSIDTSVRFLKALQAEQGVDLFDRMRFSYRQGEQVFTVPREEFAEKYAAGEIDDHTLVFDTLISNKGDLERSWEKSLGQSWHKRMV